VKSLERTLNDLLDDAGPTLGRASAIDPRRIERALSAVARRAGVVFAILVGMVGVLFVLDIVVLAMWSTQPARAAALIGASGVSLPFLLYFMRDLWRSKVQAEMMLVLAGTLDPVIVNSVLRGFRDGLRTRRTSHAARADR
jgi:hypothetical protein